MWDNNLKLRTPKKVTVKILSPVNGNWEMLSGSPLETCGIPDDVFNYHLIPKGSNPTTSNEFKRTAIIEDDIELIPYYMITINGELNKIIFIEAAKYNEYNICEDPDLKSFIESNHYSVGNSNTNTLLNCSSEVTGDLIITVMKNETFIYMEMKSEAKMTEDELAEAISKMTGINKNDIIVVMDYDDQGYVVSVSVILSDYEQYEQTVDAIMECVKTNQSNQTIKGD